MRYIIAATDITHRGLVKGPHREKWKGYYRNVKKGLVSTSVATLTGRDVLTFLTDVAKTEIKKKGYTFLGYIVPGVVSSSLGGFIYTLSNLQKVRTVGVLLYNLGGTIISGELQILDIPFILLDLTLFGEYVPTFNDTSGLFITNETVETNKFLSEITDNFKKGEL